MRQTAISASFFAALLCELAANGFASEAVTRCDELAADPHDPQRVASGVLYFDVDPAAAIPACKAALEAEPGSARLQSQYGTALFRDHRREEALVWFRKAAAQGYAAAESDLAYVLADEDPKESLRLTELAVAQGLPVAMGDLGWRYMFGIVVERDVGKALALFRQAIDQGDEYAMCHLGEMYEYGWGVDQDDSEAVKWYRTAAERQYRNGWYRLALMLLNGRGVAKDEAQARRLLEKAAAQELAPARKELDRLRARLDK